MKKSYETYGGINMKSLNKIVAGALVALAISSFPVNRVSAAESNKELLQNVVQEMQTLEGVQAEKSQLVETRVHEIESLSQSESAKNDRLAVLQEEKAAIEERNLILETLKPDSLLQAALLTIVRAYVSLDEAGIEELTVGDLAAYETYKGQYLHQDTYRKISVALEVRRTGIEKEIADIENNLANEKLKKAQYTEEVATAQKTLEEAVTTLSVLSAEKSNLEEKIKAEEAARKSSTFIWPASGRFTSPFGYRIHPIYRTRKFHNGIDIANGTGTNIVASQNGKVTFVGWEGGYGRLVIVRHANGMETAYAHLSRAVVSVGDSVTQGQVIAKMGSTGNSTGSHLHFEIRKNGTPVNPTSYLN